MGSGESNKSKNERAISQAAGVARQEDLLREQEHQRIMGILASQAGSNSGANTSVNSPLYDEMLKRRQAKSNTRIKPPGDADPQAGIL